MEIFEDIIDFQNKIRLELTTGKRIGFVPTMGALHLGHSSLIDHSVGDNNITIASIFVNPSQFNDLNDLTNYPRTPESDYKMLKDHGCDIVFCPTVEQMYPGKTEVMNFSLGSLAEVMEGKFRKGHFQGMATIVYKLLSLVNPANAYFGEKDFQQLAVIRYMVKNMHLPVNIVGCETIRESDGLAMSSRNIHLNESERANASVIYQSMKQLTALNNIYSPASVKEQVIMAIEQSGLFKVEYFEIVDAITLQSVDDWKQAPEIRACIAVKSSKTRLIDNIGVKLPEHL